MSAPLLEVRDLEAGYGAITVLHRVSLVVNAGEVVTMIGANGAGKSTTLNAICGVVRPRGYPRRCARSWARPSHAAPRSSVSG